MLEELRRTWPGRVMLRADEVALVLRGKQTPDVVKRVRGKIKDGTYGSGARRVDGLWQLPLTDLAEVIDPTPTAPPLPIPGRLPGETPQKRTRRRGIHGPSIAFIRQGRFWTDVFRAMGWSTEADALSEEIERLLGAMRLAASSERAKRSKDRLLKDLQIDRPINPSKRGPL